MVRVTFSAGCRSSGLLMKARLTCRASSRLGFQFRRPAQESARALVEIVAVLVGLAAGEVAAFQLELLVAHAQRGHPEGDVRGIGPVVGQGGIGVGHGREAVHEGHRPDGRLAGVAQVQAQVHVLARQAWV